MIILKPRVLLKYRIFHLIYSLSNGLSISEQDSKYTIQIDMGSRIYEFFTVYQYESDKWRECLTNSLKLCKDIKNSITGKPKNVNRILNIYENEGIGSLKLKIEEDLEEIIKLDEKYLTIF